jgi:hypothetical protein
LMQTLRGMFASRAPRQADMDAGFQVRGAFVEGPSEKRLTSAVRVSTI